MKRVFVAQKRAIRAIRAMLTMRPRSSCREVFRELGILTVPCLFIYAMVMFVIFFIYLFTQQSEFTIIL
jgi:hypothetical protein